MSDVLKEFLVKLAYQVDGNSQKKFEGGLKGATEAAMSMGKAIAALTAAVGVATAKISSDLDQLYFQSQRSNAAAQSIRGMAYAVSQLGGSYQAASGSIDAFSAKMRQNPGYESMIKSLGVATRVNGQLRDTPKIMADVAQKLRGKQYHVAFAYAQDLGFDEATFRAMMSGDYQKRLEEFTTKAARMGVDLSSSAEKGNRFSDAMRSLSATLGLVGNKINDSTAPGMTALVKQFDEFLQRHAKDIVKVVDDIGRVFKDLGDMLSWVGDKLAPVWEGFDKLTNSIGGRSGITIAIEALIALKLAKWLFGISRAILAVGASAGTVMGGGALARLFMLLRIGGTAALAAPLLGGAETPGSYEERRRSDPEFRKKTDEANSGNGGLIGTIKRWWNGGSKAADGQFTPYSEKNNFFDAIIKAEGTGGKHAYLKGNPYNAVLGHGQYGLPDKPITEMTLAEAYKFGRQVRSRHGSSSALGAFQIVGQTMKTYMSEAGLNWDSPFNEENQRKLASVIARRQGLGAWEGFKLHPNQLSRAQRAMEGGEHLQAGSPAPAPSSAPSSPLTRNGYAIPNFATGQPGRNFIPSGPGGVAPWANFNVPLAPSPDGGVSLNQNTTINVTGSTDPSGTASAVQGAQKSVNQGLMRNIQGATR